MANGEVSSSGKKNKTCQIFKTSEFTTTSVKIVKRVMTLRDDEYQK